ncbi:ketoacyl-ACP synthase III [Treponema primitia]|uniref:ketoacyl-ACP synthase III n=1 Tax=Treponema primitia TaxID=88058 RepID=UPI0002555560|nr:ketoacyl-ACP synthase III [Treponema primitia]
MAFLEFKNVRIVGISAAVPKKVVKLRSRNSGYSDEEYSNSVGVKETHVDDSFTTSDLCYYAAEKLITDLKWEKSEIDAIIFVSQFPDYILPATSPILQDRLGLSTECYAADVSLGCSGWVYGLSLISGLCNGSIKKALLMAGDARRMQDQKDPLFGYAGTVTAVEFSGGNNGFDFHFGSDGSGYDAIIIPDGGARNQFTAESLKVHADDDGISRNSLQSYIKGMDVFSFAITTAPKSIKKLAGKHSLDLKSVDYLILHQANKQINAKIAKKLDFEQDRVPESLTNYGNTSSASIPLTIVTGIGKRLQNESKRFIACGFGVGLSWGSVFFELDHCFISSLVEV